MNSTTDEQLKCYGKIRIMKPIGANGIMHLYIGNYYFGQFIPYQGKWDLRLQKQGVLPKDVLDQVWEMVKEIPYKE